MKNRKEFFSRKEYCLFSIDSHYDGCLIFYNGIYYFSKIKTGIKSSTLIESFLISKEQNFIKRIECRNYVIKIHLGSQNISWLDEKLNRSKIFDILGKHYLNRINNLNTV